MYIPAADTLETARVVHSALEWSAIGFFAGVVACDVCLHLIGDNEGFRIEAWHARRSILAARGRTVTFTWWPACQTGIGVKGFLRTQSLVWFGLAIILEAIALPYSRRIDELADLELTASSKQIASALTKAGNANREAGQAIREAAQLRLKATELEEGLLQQGPRDVLLGKHSETLVDALLRFKGQRVQVRKCQSEPEVLGTANQLIAIFKRAGWSVAPGSPDWGESNCGYDPTASVSGIWIGTPSATPSAETRERAKALVGFLKSIPLTVTPHSVRPDTVRAEAGSSIPGQYDDPDSIVVVVLVHPFERNKQTPPSGPSVLRF